MLKRVDARLHETFTLHVLDQGFQRSKIAGDVDNNDRLCEHVKLRGGQHLEIFVQRAEPAGQDYEGVRLLQHQHFARLQVRGDGDCLLRCQRRLEMFEEFRKDAEDLGSPVARRARNLAHQPHIAAAEQQGMAAGGDAFAQPLRSCGIKRIRGRARTRRRRRLSAAFCPDGDEGCRAICSILALKVRDAPSMFGADQRCALRTAQHSGITRRNGPSPPPSRVGRRRAVAQAALYAVALFVAQGPARPQAPGRRFAGLPRICHSGDAVSPVVLGWITDRLARPSIAASAMALTFGLICAYTAARILMQAFAQLRDGIFAKVQYHALREVGVSTFAHVHTLSLRFHLERKTGGLSRVIERGTKGIDTLLSFALFSIFPTFFQLLLFSAIMVWKLNVWIALTTLGMVGAYVWFTFAITRWRVKYRREMNDSDTDANTKAVDSLLNYETVKYFNNEAHETRRFDSSMAKFARASIQAQTSLSLLNTGQAAIMAVGMGRGMGLTAIGIERGQFHIGDLVMGNAILLQLYQPLNLLGTVYREITQALVDMEAMFRLLYQPQEVKDKPGAPASGGQGRRDTLR